MNEKAPVVIFSIVFFFLIALFVVAVATANHEVIYDCEKNRKYEIVEYHFGIKDDISHTDIPHEYCIQMQDASQ